MSDATRICPVCGAPNPERAKFCASCGAAFKAGTVPLAGGKAGAGPGTSSPVLPWFIAGVCVLTIQTAVIVLAVGRPQPAPGNQSNMDGGQAPFASGAPPTTGRAPDISNLTPREAADRLYERIAQASESGDSGQVTFFGPMAIQAYSRVSPLDADARLHIGMIQLALGDLAAAGAQADSIGREARAHLFGPLLRARVAEARGNVASARQAYRQFLSDYDAERRRNLPEYAQHANMLSEARTAAQAAGR